MQYSAVHESLPAAAAVNASCFHCGEAIPGGVELHARVKSRLQPVCCRGCQAVVEWIEGSGLNSFYEYRTDASPKPELAKFASEKWKCYDNPENLRMLVTQEDAGTRINLWVDGLRCVACAWLVEKCLQQFPAVQSVDVNAVTGAMSLRWRIQETPLSVLLAKIESLGYTPYPAGADNQTPVRSGRRKLLQQLFVAGVGMGQVMTFAIALYIGETEAMQQLYRDYFKWVSLLLTIPVVFYSSTPFFQGAWNGLRHGYLNIDLPVSLAIAAAFILSAMNTITGSGTVYFDSVTMFVFFILLGRYLQSYIRSRMGKILHMLAAIENRVVSRLQGDAEEFITVGQIRTGDCLRIKADETFPVDAIVLSGNTLADESLLTGESRPVPKNPGDNIVGGSINLRQSIDIHATAVGEATIIANIRNMAWQAQTRKPEIFAVLDRIASRFVAAVIALSVVSALVWWQIDPQRIIDITLAIWIAACPCALALAAPAALSAASSRLAAAGVWLIRSEALETLAQIDYVVFDKTGTLTSGCSSIEKIRMYRDMAAGQALEYAAALEKHSNHPYAAAFIYVAGHAAGKEIPRATEVQVWEHRGLSGFINGENYRIGVHSFVCSGEKLEHMDTGDIWLADSKGIIASFSVGDPLRHDALELTRNLRELGLQMEILSGDHESRVQEVAYRLGIEHYYSRQSSTDKMERIRQLQAAGKKVLMLGDGANDTPVLSAADVSAAINGGSAMAQSSADLLLTGQGLLPVLNAIAVAHRARNIIRQNIAWALFYNALSLPLAVTGMLQPWVAAIGMPASSLLVILNALRISKGKSCSPDALGGALRRNRQSGRNIDAETLRLKGTSR
jgi:Cu2+-exporting ATPase